MTLPPYMSREEVQRRLLLIFPDGEPRCLDAIATRVCLGDSQRTPR
jgi:nitric oxide reductase activation protein